MTRALHSYRQYTVGTCFPDAGYQVVDQHGHVYARRPRFHEALGECQRLQSIEDAEVAREACASVDNLQNPAIGVPKR